MHIVAIDAGHGMGNAHAGTYDPGAVHAEGRRVWKEAEMVMGLAIELGLELTKRGHLAYLTREDQEEPVPLGSRVKRARARNARCLVSLHMNSADTPDAHGWETFSQEGASRELAREITERVTKITPFRNRGDKDAGKLAVLRGGIDAVLLEAGFISNQQDRAWMADPGNIQRLAEAIADGIDAWLSRV